MKLANIVERSRGYFSKNDWLTLIADEEKMLIIDWVLHEKSDKYEYLWYTGQYVRSTLLASDWQTELKDIIETNAANIGDIHELFEQSIHEIQKLNIQFVDEEIFTSILTSLAGYKVNHGAYIKRGVNNSEILATVIEENFPFDIKLDSNDDNEELNRLKLIMRTQYPSIKISDKNHNLTSIIVRSNRIVLSGRGRYVVTSRIYFPEYLKKEIYSWIIEQNSTLMYNEVFEKFKGRLIFESNINNSNFLHGVLQYYYEDEFNFKHDSFSPVGQKMVRTDDRVHDLIHEYKILNIKEIQQMIPGLKDYQIFAILERSEELFNAGKNRISSTKYINFTDAQEELLYRLLNSELEENYGFTSSKVFFERLQSVGLIDENGVLNEVGMFQYIKVKTKGKLKMRYPYIFKNGVHANEENITFATVIRHFFIEGSDVINRSQIENFSRKYGLSDLSIYSFFQENSGELLRLSKNIYVPRTHSSISDETFLEIDSYLSKTVHDFLPVIDFRDYASLPNVGYEWNEFMLEDVVDKFGVRVRLIDRLLNFSHYVSSIIVPANSKLKSYEDVVVFVIESNGKKSLNEREMLSLLQSNGLTSVAIPLEISDGEHLWFNPRSDQYQIR